MNQDVEQLCEQMDELVRLHEQLIAALDQQLAAARAADPEAMQSSQQRTEQIVRQVAQVEAQRRALTNTLAVRAGLEGAAQGRGVTATRLAAALSEPARSRLIRQASLLRARVHETDRLNKILAQVSRGILEHMKSVYEAAAQLVGHTGVYAPNGRMRQVERCTVFEVVG